MPNGVSYNSYVITDEKIAVMDTVDAAFTHEWLDNLETVLKGRRPDYLVIQHMEPDHSASIAVFKKKLSRYRHCGDIKGICHDASVFRKGFHRKPHSRL